MVYLIADEPLTPTTPLTPILYCNDSEIGHKYVDETFTQIANKNRTPIESKISVSFYKEMPVVATLDLGYFCVTTDNDLTDGDILYELYQCSVKEYGWIRSDVRKRAKKIKGIVMYRIPQYQSKPVAVTPVVVPDIRPADTPSQWVVDTKRYLADFDRAPDQEAKIRIVLELFEYLFQQRQVAFKSKYFSDTVKSKLVEFYYSNNVLECKEYYEKIFEQPFPSTALPRVQ
jgi:hypothetical protein